MKGQLFIIVAIIVLFAVPVSVYAFNSTIDTQEITTTTTETNEVIPTDDNYGMMRNYELMVQMMNSGIDCFNTEEHQQFIESQKAIINEQLLAGEITEEQANQLLADLDLMLQFHERYHTDNPVDETPTSRRGCH